MKGKFVRLKYSTYKRLRKNFKGERGESFSHYIDRLSKALEAGWDRILENDKRR